MGAIEKTTNLFAENVSRNERFVDSILRDVEQVTGSVASATGAEGNSFSLLKLASLGEVDNIAGKSRYHYWAAIVRTQRMVRFEPGYVTLAKASTT